MNAPRSIRQLVIAAIAVLALASPPPASASAFCDNGVIHDYLKPLEGLPALRKPPLDQHLPFGPTRVFFGRIGQGPLLVGNNETGYFLSFSPFQAGHHRSPRLDWTVVARLISVDRRGHPIQVLQEAERQVRWLRSTDDQPSGDLSFSFHVAKPALYRVEITFQDRSGKRLARFGEYVRVLRPSLDTHLTLNGASFHPGDTVIPRLENYGASFLRFGLIGASTQHYDGTAWVQASFGNGSALAIGLGIGPGETASCWGRTIPLDTPPGLYRFSLEIESLSSLRSRAIRSTLTTEFQILPPG